MPHDILLTLELDSGARRYSLHGTAAPGGHFEGRIRSFGELRREVRLGGGLSPVANARVVLRDEDGALRTLARSEPLRLRRATLQLADMDSGVVETLFEGLIDRTSFSREICDLELRDDSLDRLTDPASPLVVFPDLFPDMPQTTPVSFVPIVLGTVDSTDFDNLGHIPAFLVDPKQSQAKYRYVAAQHPLKSITAVYRNGELVPSADYDIAYANVSTAPFGTVRMTFIDFDRDPRDAEDRNPLITYDAEGMTDDNTESGDLITDPAAALVALLGLRTTLGGGEWDSTFLTACQSALSAAGLTIGHAIVRETSWLDILDALLRSFSIQMFRTRSGLFALRFDDGSTGSASTVLTDQNDVLSASLNQRRGEDAVSTLDFRYAADHARGGSWTARNSWSDSSEETALGRDIVENVELPGVRALVQAKALSQIRLWHRRTERIHADLSIAVRPTLELGDLVSISHWAGLSADNLGWRNELFRITSIGLQITAAGEAQQKLRLVDAPGLTLDAHTGTDSGRESETLAVASAEMASDIVFTPADHNTVTWSSHTLKFSHRSGTVTFAGIASGTTGNMVATTYVYFDPDANTGALQQSTNYADAVGPRKRLLAVCKAASSSSRKALIDNRVGFVDVGGSSVPFAVESDQLADDFLLSRHVGPGVILAENVRYGMTFKVHTLAPASIGPKSFSYGAFSVLLPDGSTHSINAGSITFPDYNTSYLLYVIEGNSALQVTATATNASGEDRHCLGSVRTAPSATGYSQIELYNGINGSTVAAHRILCSDLAAINAVLGKLTSGEIDVNGYLYLNAGADLRLIGQNAPSDPSEIQFGSGSVSSFTVLHQMYADPTYGSLFLGPAVDDEQAILIGTQAKRYATVDLFGSERLGFLAVRNDPAYNQAEISARAWDTEASAYFRVYFGDDASTFASLKAFADETSRYLQFEVDGGEQLKIDAAGVVIDDRIAFPDVLDLYQSSTFLGKFWLDTSNAAAVLTLGLSTGAYRGGLVLDRKTDGTDYPGVLGFIAADGGGLFAWSDNNDNFKVGTSIPSPGTGDTDGYVLGPDRLQLKDGVTAPSTAAGRASIYIDSADGDLKIKFGDGTVKTIVTDS